MSVGNRVDSLFEVEEILGSQIDKRIDKKP